MLVYWRPVAVVLLSCLATLAVLAAVDLHRQTRASEDARMQTSAQAEVAHGEEPAALTSGAPLGER